MAENATPSSKQDPATIQRGTKVDDGRDRVLATQVAGKQQEAQPGPDQQHGGRERRKEQEQDLPKKRATYLTLMGLFVGLFVALTAREGKRGRRSPAPIRPFDVALLALATFRLARIVAFDPITEPVRAPVARDTEEGPEPKGRGVQRALGELISCPMCVGVWIGAALTYGLLWLPGPTRVFVAMFGAAGAAEALDYTMSVLDATTKARTKQAEADTFGQ
jgi:hypothetical protein